VNVVDAVADASIENNNFRRLTPSGETSASDPTELSRTADALGLTLVDNRGANSGRLDVENASTIKELQKHVIATT
jgi:hypothetical protein